MKTAIELRTEAKRNREIARGFREDVAKYERTARRYDDAADDCEKLAKAAETTCELGEVTERCDDGVTVKFADDMRDHCELQVIRDMAYLFCGNETTSKYQQMWIDRALAGKLGAVLTRYSLTGTLCEGGAA